MKTVLDFHLVFHLARLNVLLFYQICESKCMFALARMPLIFASSFVSIFV